jgi:hypothetical protein
MNEVKITPIEAAPVDAAPVTQPIPAPQPQGQVLLKKASELDLGWTNGSYIPTICEVVEEPPVEAVNPSGELKFSYFTVKSNMQESEREKQEKIAAIHKQIDMGILKPNGVPYGMKSEEEKQAEQAAKGKKYPNKFARKIERNKQRAIEKDMARMQRENQKGNLGIDLNRENNTIGSILNKFIRK